MQTPRVRDLQASLGIVKELAHRAMKIVLVRS
jgi:hypothetical protein